MIGRGGILKLGDLGLACRYRKAAPPLDVSTMYQLLPNKFSPILFINSFVAFRATMAIADI